MLVDPTPVGVRENSSFDGSLLVMVTGRLFGAFPVKETVIAFCKPCPIVVFVGAIVLVDTVAFTKPPVTGVVNPDGALAIMSVVPVLIALARKLAVAVSAPPLKLTDAAETVPTLATLLLNGTDTVRPPRTCWIAPKAPEAFNRPELIVNPVVVPWNAVNGVPSPSGPVMKNPEEAKVIVTTFV